MLLLSHIILLLYNQSGIFLLVLRLPLYYYTIGSVVDCLPV